MYTGLSLTGICEYNWGRQEERAILISRLLLRMRHMYVASIGLDSIKNEWNAENAIWSRTMDFLSLVIWSRVFWHLSRETYAMHGDEAKAFLLSIFVARTP